MTGECQRKGCEETATTVVEWLAVSEPLEYCEGHARGALQRFPDLARLADGEELTDHADATAGGEA